MSNIPRNLTRNQLAEFLPNARAIRAFEQMLKNTSDLLPADLATINRLIQELTVDAGTASAAAQTALDSLVSLEQELATNISSADGKATEALTELANAVRVLSLLATAPIVSAHNSTATDYLDLNPNAPTAAENIGRLKWGPTGTLELSMGGGNITQQVGEEIFVYGKASAAITEGQLIMVTGSVGASGVLTFAPTTIGLTDPNAILGVATENLALNAFGRVTIIGIVHGINTTGSSVGEVWADGDVLWYNPSFVGGMTKVKPAAPNMKTQVAIVINAGGGGSGSLQVEVINGSMLGGTDSNVQLGALVDKQLLQYDAVAGYWKNVALSSSGAVTSVSGTAPVVSSGGVTPAISLAANYGDTLNPYASKTAKFFLAAPNAAAGVPTFRAIVASDIPTLNQSTTGTASNVTGTVAVANGGTGLTSLTANYIPWGNGTGAYSSSNAFKFTGSILAISAPSVTPQGKVHIGDGTDNSTTVKSTEFLVTADDPTWVGSGGSFQVNRIWLNVSWLSLKVSNGAARFIAMDVNSDGSISPGADNSYSCGTSAKRWSVVYAGTGAINTSDANTKCQIEDLDDAEKRVATKLKGLIKKFKFKDAVEEKGEDARIHVGAIAQDVEAAFKSEGLDANKYALFCSDTWYEKEVLVQYEAEEGEEPRTELKVQQFKEPIDGATKHVRLGLRYDQLLAFIISSI